MKQSERKRVTIITEAVIEKEIVSVLEELKVPGYTIWDARGKGRRGDRTSGWEYGANICLEIICETMTAQTIVRALHARFDANYAMIVYMTDVSVVTP